MKNLISAAAALALFASAGIASAQQPQQQDTRSGSQTAPNDKSASQPKAGMGGTATKTEIGSNAVQDNEKKAQQGAKQNAMTPSSPGAAKPGEKIEKGGMATQDVVKKSQQGNTPNK